MMARAIEDTLNLDFTGCYYGADDMSISTNTTPTTTTTATDDDHLQTWGNWSSVVDWDALSAARHDVDDCFDDLIDCMMDDTVFNLNEQIEDHESKVHIGGDAQNKANTNNNNDDDMKGLRLVHLLMAAAEALTGPNKSRELAQVILVRLKELASPCNGTNIERVAAYFTDALYNIVQGVSLYNHAKLSNGSKRGGFFHHHRYHHSTDDVLAAYQLLQDMSPYVKFGHFTANQAILEAVSNDRRVHIVDYDIMEGIQWASLMQAFVSRKDGPSTHLRITAVSRGANGGSSIGTVKETGRRLVAFAASIGQPLSFHLCRLDSNESFRPCALKLVREEALVFNCMLHLPHFSNRSPESIASFLLGAKSLNPKLVTLVEEEIGPMEDNGFVGRFMDSLYHYSAIYDSLESGFPMQTQACGLVERVFLGPRIVGSLAHIYHVRAEEEISAWREYLLGLGFGPTSISFSNHCQAKLLLGLFNDGYRVEEVANNRLVLGWKCRQLLSASIWTSNFDFD